MFYIKSIKITAGLIAGCLLLASSILQAEGEGKGFRFLEDPVSFHSSSDDFKLAKVVICPKGCKGKRGKRGKRGPQGEPGINAGPYAFMSAFFNQFDPGVAYTTSEGPISIQGTDFYYAPILFDSFGDSSLGITNTDGYNFIVGSEGLYSITCALQGLGIVYMGFLVNGVYYTNFPLGASYEINTTFQTGIVSLEAGDVITFILLSTTQDDTIDLAQSQVSILQIQ